MGVGVVSLPFPSRPTFLFSYRPLPKCGASSKCGQRPKRFEILASVIIPLYMYLSLGRKEKREEGKGSRQRVTLRDSPIPHPQLLVKMLNWIGH